MERYIKNTNDIINFTQKSGIPLVIMTPISELMRRPYGVYPQTDLKYEQGMQEPDYQKKIAELIEASNMQLFNYNFGIKSYSYDFLLNLKKPGVYVFNTLEALMGKDCGLIFSDEGFYDRIHMKTRLHRIIADALYRYLVANKLL